MKLFDFSWTLPITDPTWAFFLVLIIILFAPMLLGRLRIPHIVGMVIAGVLIGEHGFHILNHNVSFELFGKAGLYYIVFLVGLEMNMEDLKKNKKQGIVFGCLTFLIPMLLGVWSSISILEYGVATAVLLAGIYSFQSLIAYPVINRYGLSRLRSVHIAIGGTVVTVTMVLIILAVISGIYKGGIADDWGCIFWLIKLVLVTFLIIFFFPRIGRWFFRKYSDSVMQFVFVLAMAFLGGGMMELVGMEGIIGVFLVGLVLNRLIPHVSPLMNRLEFVGNALFIPFFLIGVGMSADVTALFAGGKTLKVAIVMTVMAVVSKWLAAWVTQKIYRMQPNERNMMFSLSSGQAAATLAVVLIGYNIIMFNGERLLGDDILTGAVVMTLITCIISPLAAEHSAKRFALDKAIDSENGSNVEMPEQILIAVANPETIENLVNLALVIKDTKQKNGLIALNVINDSSDAEKKELHGRQCLEKAAMIAAATDVPVSMVSRYDSNITSGIVHTVKEHNVTDVVIGLHRKANFVDSFFGDMLESLLKETNREVMIAKFLMPVNTLRRINVAVPPNAEYETGFLRWVEHLCRMGGILGCRVHFFANKRTLARLQGLVDKKFTGTLTEFTMLEEWGDLLMLTGQVNYDHLLVVVSARRGSISYDQSFERLPEQLGRYFTNNSLLILYPEQFGDSQDTTSGSESYKYNKSQSYDKLGRWFCRWLKKK